MTLLTRAHLLDKYGVRLSMEQLGEVLGLHHATLYTQLNKGILKIRTYKEGHRRFASVDAVVEYLQAMDDEAKVGR